MSVAWAIVGAIAAAVAVSLFLWMRSASDPLRLAPGYVPCRVLGRVPDPLVCLQLARTRARTEALLGAWLQHAALLDQLIVVDFAFIVAYGVAGVIASLAIGVALGAFGLTVAFTDGAAFATMTVIAAALDVAENGALLIQIRDIPRSTYAMLAFVCALGKFVLLALVATWLVCGTVVALFAFLAAALGAPA